MAEEKSQIPALLKKQSAEVLEGWVAAMATVEQGGQLAVSELRAQAKEFLDLLSHAVAQNNSSHFDSAEWAPVRDFLDNLSRSRAQQGFTSAQTATFIFSLKRPLFTLLQSRIGKDADKLAIEVWGATELIDSLGLYTVKSFQKSREEIITRQQEEMLELSTPVVKLWEGVLALPMIGTLDSGRTQIVMESLLQRIVDTGSEIAIIDITGYRWSTRWLPSTCSKR
jgi:rsbT co-antagonist protein RsbR